MSLEEKHKFIIEHLDKIEKLTKTFGTYVTRIDSDTIKHFLLQFDLEHLPVAIKLLQNIDYYDTSRRLSLLDNLSRLIILNSNQALEDVLICPLKEFYGDSSYQMHRLFHRHLKSLTKNCKKFDQKWVGWNDIDRFDERKMTIFFVDDFIGSGDTVIGQWGLLQHYENRKKHRYCYAALVGYRDSIADALKQTFGRLEIIVSNELSETDRIFNDKNTVLSADEKEILKTYCHKVANDKEHVYGHKNSQSVVIFQDGSPNNAIPILTNESNGWYPLFPRHY
jgi:hypothetical protein